MAKELQNYLDGRFPLKIIPINRQDDNAIHTHPFTELVIVTRGEGIHFLGNHEYPVTAGDVFVIHGTEAHGYRKTNKLQLKNIIYDMSRLELPLGDLPRLGGYHALFNIEPHFRKSNKTGIRFRLSLKELNHTVGIVDRIWHETEEKHDGFECMAKALFLQLMCYLSRHYTQSEIAAPRECLRLGNVFSFLEENFREQITVEELCGIAHMSESSLLRAFKQTTGHSPSRYIIHIRIRHACELLRQTDLNMSEITFECGFNDSNYFSRTFKSVTGMPPTDFRKTIAEIT